SAKVYIQQDDWDKATEQLEQAVDLYPNDAEAHALLGEAYGRKGQFEKMNKEFEASLAITPKYSERINQLRYNYWANTFNAGVGKINQGNIEEAIESFSTCLIIDPIRPEAYRNLAYAYIKNGQTDKAIESYQKLLAQHPADLETQKSLGNLYLSNQQYQEALEIFQKARESAPGDAEILRDLALTYDFLGQSDKAFEIYQQALNANPEDKDLLFNFGRLYYLKKDYPNAIEQFKKVVEKDPNDAESLVNIGNAYLNMAEEYRVQLREIEETEKKPSQEKMSDLFSKMKDNFSKAIPYLEKAVELKPDNPNVWYNLGVAYVNCGMKEKGDAAFKKADELKN
ncbi:MAG: tetratricopeptide repeat protein, partial [candidate division KSB1 bacterium]|nr:tetratricopeptide repeat protein [candidate division KSB1 bacterium]